MKILFTSDLHGNINLYQDLYRIIKQENVKTIIIGGDLLPRKGQPSKSLNTQRDFVKEYLQIYLKKIKQDFNTAVYIILGNNDWAATIPIFKDLEDRSLLHLLHNQTFSIAQDLFITGYPYVPPTPFFPKDFEKRDLIQDIPKTFGYTPAISISGSIEEVDSYQWFSDNCSIEEDLQNLMKPILGSNTILVMHSPPYNTLLDRTHSNKPVGSKAILDFIKKRQPAITLHGHIHESPSISGSFYQMIGSTLCLNPGQTENRLSAVILDPKRPFETLSHTLYKNQGNPFHFHKAGSS